MDSLEILRKAKIRREAVSSKKGNKVTYHFEKLDFSELQELEEKIFYDIKNLNEYSCNTLHIKLEATSESGKLRIIIKKVLRRITQKLLGWYYIPIIDGQIAYNSSIKEIMGDLQKVMDNQQKRIEELEDYIKSELKEDGGTIHEK